MTIKSKPKSKGHRNESTVNLDPDSSRKNPIPTGSSIDLRTLKTFSENLRQAPRSRKPVSVSTVNDRQPTSTEQDKIDRPYLSLQNNFASMGRIALLLKTHQTKEAGRHNHLIIQRRNKGKIPLLFGNLEHSASKQLFPLKPLGPLIESLLTTLLQF